MYHFFHTILIARYISIAEDRNMEVLLEFIDAPEVSLAYERLLVRATMNRDEIGSSVLESLAELYQE